jgi:hypothetical protein
MTLTSLFGFRFGASPAEIPEIFPFPYLEKDFITTDIVNIYSRIITDVLERTQGIPEKHLNLLWDNCLASEHQDGLVTMIAKAMAEKKDLFLVFDKALNIIREAKQDERAQIEADYKKKGEHKAESKAGVFITFKKYNRTDMMKIYSALEYCTVASLSKSMNLSKAIQLKLHELRSSTGLTDSNDVKTQAVALACALRDGKDISIDAKDIIETAKPDLTATQSSMEFIVEKRAFYLGLPSSYITGIPPKGLGDTGEGDAKAVERGLKQYYFSIVKPVIEALFENTTTFKSEDFRQITSSLETLKTFELVSGELISQDNKLKLINKLFGFPENEKGDPPEKPDTALNPQGVPPPGGKAPPAPGRPPPPPER